MEASRSLDGSLTSSGWKIHDPAFLGDSFDRDRRSSPWAGHRWFAYDLIRWMKPATIVELGSHYGCSFYSFCQAVGDGGLETTLCAVDTWEGDDHAGRYGDDVHDSFVRNLTHFEELAVTVKRMTFDEALSEQEPGSVDVLHIDGFHSYEALEHDLTTWLPTMSERAVILVHDVALDSGYGSAQYWGELTQRFTTIEFAHNFGLGVIAIGAEVTEMLLSEDFRVSMPFYGARAAADLSEMQVEDLQRMVDDRDQALASQTQRIDDLDTLVRAQDALIRERDEALSDQARFIDDQVEALAAQARYIDEQVALMAAQDELVRARDAQIAELAARSTH